MNYVDMLHAWVKKVGGKVIAELMPPQGGGISTVQVKRYRFVFLLNPQNKTDAHVYVQLCTVDDSMRECLKEAEKMMEFIEDNRDPTKVTPSVN